MQYGYGALFALLVAGIVGLPVPDETLLTLAGFLVYKGKFELIPMLLAGFLGSACGITVSYLIGRTAGIYTIHKFGRFPVSATSLRLSPVPRVYRTGSLQSSPMSAHYSGLPFSSPSATTSAATGIAS